MAEERHSSGKAGGIQRVRQRLVHTDLGSKRAFEYSTAGLLRSRRDGDEHGLLFLHGEGAKWNISRSMLLGRERHLTSRMKQRTVEGEVERRVHVMFLPRPILPKFALSRLVMPSAATNKDISLQ